MNDVVGPSPRLSSADRQLSGESILLIGEAEALRYDEVQHLLGQLIHGEQWGTREIPKSLAKAGAWVQDQVPARNRSSNDG